MNWRDQRYSAKDWIGDYSAIQQNGCIGAISAIQQKNWFGTIGAIPDEDWIVAIAAPSSTKIG